MGGVGLKEESKVNGAKILPGGVNFELCVSRFKDSKWVANQVCCEIQCPTRINIRLRSPWGFFPHGKWMKKRLYCFGNSC